ncbi:MULTISPECIES: J domain-containing protein [Clostridium]|mgnify:CR=1 FL=1|jgi:curved DNA-binding protein CbpA|uniref:Chaperone protein DnaJ n=2 Tax=Clostridium TaxID=1485 RepID=A0A151ANG0_9CLOT|nr:MULTISPECIES: DnaJ domain-containing protein [Clostridium]KYH29149.1 chaperone protein DnaJ [Clostridium colicanis DSM 13634]MBE6043741.1 molecular chaperone DnaJ [Clostridium thermopalmarium]PRR73790.1 Chaperone protein DnaJ [Clostridium thermopalmarium DSM 5974]PVZ21169.1 DnaJ-like protein [Clostridium thermopalmarium DSM 5974]
MTDYYKILGIKENASKEEIKKAYEKHVEKIKKEVVNEKRLNEFLKLFNEAYEALMSLEENQSIDRNATLIINSQEMQEELDANDNTNNKNIHRHNSKSRGRGNSIKKNNLMQKVHSQNRYNRSKLNDNKKEKRKKQKNVKESSKGSAKQIFDLLMLPLKMLALPIIAILSVIILLCEIINIISWIATKLLIVGSISIGAIHLYQVKKLGQTINYNILILAVSVLLASFFLPYILKFILKVLKAINDILKDFVF